MRWRVKPARSIRCDIRVPGDKSISHRAVMLGAVAEGTSQITGFSDGEDNLRTRTALAALGADIRSDAPGQFSIAGVGLRGLREAGCDLDMGNSGTAMRLLTGLLCAQPFASRLIGDASLSARPMRRVIEPLGRMGARISAQEGGTAPLKIAPADAPMKGGQHRLEQVSAQVKSALLLAGLYADEVIEIFECGISRNHTEIMLEAMGAEISGVPGERVHLVPPQRLQALSLDIPGDLSAAAFLLVAGALAEKGSVQLRDVGINPTRDGVLRILTAMGADIRVADDHLRSGEALADLTVKPSALGGIAIEPEWVPLAIDEFPVLLIAAACAEGVTELRGAAELRVKETDRLQAMTEVLRALGVHAEPLPDGIVIEGLGADGRFSGGHVRSHGDHRIAMAAAVAALRADGDIVIDDCECVATSWPGFAEVLSRAGVSVEA